jgi:quercetin dioxygenase-like cupin family protein
VSILEQKNIFDNQKFISDGPAKDPIYISEKFKVMRISLKKGLEIAPHEGSHPIVFLILKGKAIFPTASGEVELGENDYITYSETEPRGIKSLEDLVVLAIRD